MPVFRASPSADGPIVKHEYVETGCPSADQQQPAASGPSGQPLPRQRYFAGRPTLPSDVGGAAR